MWDKHSDAYHYDCKGSIPLSLILSCDTNKHIHVFRYAVIIRNDGYYLIEPPEPDNYELNDPFGVMRYLNDLANKTSVYRFSSIEELNLILLSKNLQKLII